MNKRPEWILPDLKKAQVRTKNTIERIDSFIIPENAKFIGNGKKYYISTYGCQANERDSETLAGILDSLGFEKSESPEDVDVILINTCAIRQNAEEKVLGEIGNFKRLYRANKDLVIGVYRFIHPNFVKRIKLNGIRIVHINPDALTTFEQQQLFVEAYDVYFTKDPYILRFMRDNMKLNVKLYSESFNVRYHKKPEINKQECEKEVEIDVMTYGTMYPYRVRMLSELLENGINLQVYGVKPHRFYNHVLGASFQNRFIAGAEKARLLYGAKIVFNQMHYAEIDSVNNRFFEVNGSGAFQLSDYRPILHDLLPIDPELVSFRSIDEGIAKIKYYLSHPDERYSIASEVYQYFVKKYTYDNLVEYLLENTFN